MIKNTKGLKTNRRLIWFSNRGFTLRGLQIATRKPSDSKISIDTKSENNIL